VAIFGKMIQDNGLAKLADCASSFVFKHSAIPLFAGGGSLRVARAVHLRRAAELCKVAALARARAYVYR
jgi:hypothetical protein